MSLLFTFDGRIGRSQFWLGYLAGYGLVNILIAVPMVAAMLIALFAGPSALAELVVTGADGLPTINYSNMVLIPFWICYAFAVIAWLWATIAISIKRFHDRGKSTLPTSRA